MLSVFYSEDNPTDPPRCVCSFLHPSSHSLLVVKYIGLCGMNLEEPAHMVQPRISSAEQPTSLANSALR